MQITDYFTYENCYEGIQQEASFNEYKESAFQIYTIDSVEDCQNYALEAKTQFFLISDLCNNDQTSQCYIPKVNTNNSCLDTLENTFKPFFDILHAVVGEFPRSIVPVESNNNLTTTNSRCLLHIPSGQYYAPKNKFALYNSSILDQDIVNILRKIKSHDYYNSKLPQLSDYDNLIQQPTYNSTSESYSGGGTIAYYFKKYTCNPTQENLNNFKNQITILDNKYNGSNGIFSSLDEITFDLSSINLLINNDKRFVLEIDKLIELKKNELNALLGSGGANNGRLDDTNYLKNLKFTEIIILGLVLLIAILIYIKKK